jgi:hypothetical protein
LQAEWLFNPFDETSPPCKLRQASVGDKVTSRSQKPALNETVETKGERKGANLIKASEEVSGPFVTSLKLVRKYLSPS